MNTGVYFGWASVESADNVAGRNRPIKAVVNVGYSPTFEGEENKEKIVEVRGCVISTELLATLCLNDRDRRI